MADSDWTTPGEGNWLYDRYSDIASVPMSWADRALALVRGQPYVAPNTRDERQALRANPYAFTAPSERRMPRQAPSQTAPEVSFPSRVPLPPTIPDRGRPTTTEGRVTPQAQPNIFQRGWDALDSAQAGIDRAAGLTPMHLPGANYQRRSGPPSVYEAAESASPESSFFDGFHPPQYMRTMSGGNDMRRSPTPATPLPHPGQRMGAMPLRHPGQETPPPPTRDDTDGMHKVWYGKDPSNPKSDRMVRLGVGEKPPEGVDPDSYTLEPNKMTGFQRFMRQAWDVDEAGKPKSFWDNFKGKAGGGSVEHAARIAGEKSTPCHTGIIHMAVGGRTDHLPMNVLEGSYVLPADVVSGLGEGNTLAGGKILDNMFSGKMGPGGSRIPDFKATPKYPDATRISPEDYSKYLKMGQEAGRSFMGKEQKDVAAGNARGGVITSHNRRPVPIIAAGGEYVISPDDVMHYGEGDLDQGHEKLDNFVKFVRANTVKTLKNLPGPRKD